MSRSDAISAALAITALDVFYKLVKFTVVALLSLCMSIACWILEFFWINFIRSEKKGT